MERYSFRRVSGDLTEAMRKLPFHKISTPGNQVKLRPFTQCLKMIILMLILSVSEIIDQKYLIAVITLQVSSCSKSTKETREPFVESVQN